MKSPIKYLSRKRRKQILWLFILLLMLPFVFALTANKIVEYAAENRTYNNVEEISANHVGMVLGTAKYRSKGEINLFFQYRIEATVQLYKSGKINFVLVSGDNSTQYYNEPKAFKKALIQKGIPENKIYLDYAGFRTLDSVIRAYKVFGQSKFTIISQKFHNERAIYLAQKHGIDAVGFNAKDVTKNYGFKTQLREYLARSKAILDVLFGVEPKFLGEQIRIK